MFNDSLLLNLEPISLQNTNEVKLMNRIDSKYVLSYDALNHVLNTVRDKYFVLEINNSRILPYESLYFDTKQNSMYLAHHNGKTNRYKIRYRNYQSTNETFLEVKYKLNGIRTIKKRIKVKGIEKTISNTSEEFIQSASPFFGNMLEPKIYTNFKRITLVNKNLLERVTIDTDLQFCHFIEGKYDLTNTSIIETKREAHNCNSAITRILQDSSINPGGMSKYCFGRVVLDKNLKNNLFKEKQLLINKIENGKFYYRNNSVAKCN